MKILFSNSEIDIIVRRGERSDAAEVRNLLIEDGLYESPGRFVPDTDELIEDCFGKNAAYHFFTAVKDGQICGVLFYYLRFMPERGRCLYIDELVIKDEFFGLGVGNLLMDAAAKEAMSFSANLITWQVTDWSEVAINFYKRFERKFVPEREPETVPA